MLERDRLENLKIEQLFALALHTLEYNIHFFCSWANRLRPYDEEPVVLLAELAGDAKQYHQTLYEASQRLFQSGLPELESEMQTIMRPDFDLPDARYFVICEKEVRLILDVALSLQQNAIKLLTVLDEALHNEYNSGASSREQALASQEALDTVDATKASCGSSQLLSQGITS